MKLILQEAREILSTYVQQARYYSIIGEVFRH